MRSGKKVVDLVHVFQIALTLNERQRKIGFSRAAKAFHCSVKKNPKNV